MTLSLLVEVPLALLLGPRQGRTAVAAVAATLVTHPVLWAAWFPVRGALSWTATALVLEGAVAAVEAGIYRITLPVSWGRAALMSAVANGASFGLGLVLG